MRLLLLDNYDSFTYNLFHYLEPLVSEIVVCRNDAFELHTATEFDRIVFSPGPGLPKDAGVMPQLIKQYHQQIPMLGVCLGMQAMAECFGGSLQNLPTVLHGQSSQCHVLTPDETLFKNMPNNFAVGHYHSWVVNEATLPACLQVTAKNEHGLIMALRHLSAPLRGVQFHPESVLTPEGRQILQNWVAH
jgi:anthranilate synthase component II